MSYYENLSDGTIYSHTCITDFFNRYNNINEISYFVNVTELESDSSTLIAIGLSNEVSSMSGNLHATWWIWIYPRYDSVYFFLLNNCEYSGHQLGRVKGDYALWKKNNAKTLSTQYKNMNMKQLKSGTGLYLLWSVSSPLVSVLQWQ